MNGWPAWVLVAGILSPLGGAAHRDTERGNEHYERGEHEQALQAYTEAQLERPEAPELYYNIGNVLYRQEDYAGAGEAYTRALGAAPPQLLPRVAFNLGNALFQQERFDEAAREYRRALEADPSDESAKRNLELALREIERRKQQNDQDGDGENQDGEGDRQNGDGEDQQQQHGQQHDPKQGDDPRQDPRQNQDDEPHDNREQGRAEPPPGQMTPEDAERLLDTLAEGEQENLREQARRQVRGRRRGTEEDW